MNTLSTQDQKRLKTVDRLDRDFSVRHHHAVQLQVNVPAVAWREIGAAGSPAFENSWANFGAGRQTAAFRVDERGAVFLKGLVRAGTLNTACTTLPVGYRPPLAITLATISNNVLGRVDVDANGGVIAAKDSIGSNVFVSLDGISFFATTPAAPDAWTGTGWPMQVQTPLTVGVRGAVVWRAVDLTDGQRVMHGTPGIVWEPSGVGGLSIRAFPGLSPGRRYLVTVVVHGG